MSYRMLQSLLLRSFTIQEGIEDEQKGKAPDRSRLLKLKKLRLVINDRLQRLFGGAFDGSAELRPIPVPARKKRYW